MEQQRQLGETSKTEQEKEPYKTTGTKKQVTVHGDGKGFTIWGAKYNLNWRVQEAKQSRKILFAVKAQTFDPERPEGEQFQPLVDKPIWLDKVGLEMVSEAIKVIEDAKP